MANVNVEMHGQWKLSSYRMELKEPEMEFLPSMDCTQRWGGRMSHTANDGFQYALQLLMYVNTQFNLKMVHYFSF